MAPTRRLSVAVAIGVVTGLIGCAWFASQGRTGEGVVFGVVAALTMGPRLWAHERIRTAGSEAGTRRRERHPAAADRLGLIAIPVLAVVAAFFLWLTIRAA